MYVFFLFGHEDCPSLFFPPPEVSLVTVIWQCLKPPPISHFLTLFAAVLHLRDAEGENKAFELILRPKYRCTVLLP